jgi:hypothetical protein
MDKGRDDAALPTLSKLVVIVPLMPEELQAMCQMPNKPQLTVRFRTFPLGSAP